MRGRHRILPLVVVALACGNPTAGPWRGDGAAWPEARGSRTRVAGAGEANALTPPLYLAWQTRAGRSPTAAPALTGDAMIVASTDRKVRLLDVATGRTHWRQKLDGTPSIPVVTGTDHAFIGHQKPHPSLIALDIETGDVAWRRKDVSPQGGPLIRGRTLYVADAKRGLLALDTRTGETEWAWPEIGRWPAPFMEVAGRLLVADERDSIRALDLDSRRVAWSAPLVGGARGAAAGVDGDVVVAGTLGQVLRLDGRTGAVRWRVDVGQRVYGSVMIVDADVFVVGLGGRLFVLDAASGATRWTVELDGPCRASPALAGNLVVVGTMTATCQLVSRSERRVVHTVDLKRAVEVGAIVSRDRLITIDRGGYVYAYESAS